jgi:two-component system OmpR family response regulator
LCEWGEEVSNNAIEVYVHRLRKKIEAAGARIVTVRGLGYSLEKAVASNPAPVDTTLAAHAPGVDSVAASPHHK